VERAIRPDRAAIYIRWSTDDQASGTTLAVQREGCEHFLRSQGWQVREDLLFVDDGYSGGNLDRPALTRLRRQVQAGEVDCVVVLKIDRLSRNLVDAVDLVLREWAERCHVKSVREPIATTSDLGRMIFGILAMFADFERAAIRERTQTGKTRRIAEGRQLHAEPAFGYARHPTEKGRWIENPAEGPLVRRLFCMAADGLSASAICRQLNGEGQRTRAGKAWSLRSLLWLLHNRIYIGEVVYGRTSLLPAPAAAPAAPGAAQRSGLRPPARRRLVRVTHATPKVSGPTAAAPALVEPALFATAQARLAAHAGRRREAGSRAAASPHLLTGLARCGCGAALVYKAQRRGGYYICSRSRQGSCRAQGHVPAGPAEQLAACFFANLYGLRSLPAERLLHHARVATEEQAGVAAGLQRATTTLAQLAAEDDRLLREARAGQVAPEDLRDLRRSLAADQARAEALRAALQARQAALTARATQLQQRLRAETDWWATLPAPEQRLLLGLALTERMTATRARGGADTTLRAEWRL